MRPITGRHSLSLPSLTRLTNSFPCGLHARYRDELRRWRTVGLTVFRIKDKSTLGSAFSTSRLHAFWLKRNSALGLLLIKTVYEQFEFANHTAQPCTPSAAALADNNALSRDHRRSMSGLRCPSDLTPIVTNPACTGRLSSPAVGCRPMVSGGSPAARLLPAGACSLAPVPQALPRSAHGRTPACPPAVLQPVC